MITWFCVQPILESHESTFRCENVVSSIFDRLSSDENLLWISRNRICRRDYGIGTNQDLVQSCLGCFDQKWEFLAEQMWLRPCVRPLVRSPVRRPHKSENVKARFVTLAEPPATMWSPWVSCLCRFCFLIHFCSANWNITNNRSYITPQIRVA